MGCIPADYPKVASVISKLFYDVEIVDVAGNFEGVNKDTHLVATTSHGEKFGLKLFERTGSVSGAEKDKLMADIARLAGMPNACRVERSNEFGFIDEFTGRVVSVTRWLPDSKSLKRVVDDHVWVEILDSADTFHFQVGQWMSLGYAFAVSDRGIGNWVWNHAERKLAMIDMEFAFALNQPSLSDFNELLGRFVTKKTEMRTQQLETIRSGFCDGWKLLNNEEANIRLWLQAEAFSKDYDVPLQQDSTAIITPHLQAYGL